MQQVVEHVRTRVGDLATKRGLKMHAGLIELVNYAWQNRQQLFARSERGAKDLIYNQFNKVVGEGLVPENEVPKADQLFGTLCKDLGRRFSLSMTYYTPDRGG